MPRSEIDSTRATAHLPGLDVEIVHHQSPDGLTERVSINLTAAPSFEAFARSPRRMEPLCLLGRGHEARMVPLGRRHTHDDEGPRPPSIAAKGWAGAARPATSPLLDKRNGLARGRY